MPLRRPVGLLALLALTASLLVLFPVSAVQAVSPNLVISQVYGGGGNSGAPLQNDYVELFNRGADSASTAGMSVQYASASGTGNFGATSGRVVALPDTTVPAGGYLLVQLGAGAGSSTALPTPDATGTINMSATAGKVALATGTDSLGCNGGSTACTPEQLARIVDLVGYGSATFFEGTAAAPTLSNTTAGLRRAGGCTDTDQNSTDIAAGEPAPRNSATAPAACGTDRGSRPDREPDPGQGNRPDNGAGDGQGNGQDKGQGRGKITRISAVQGSGEQTPLAGQAVRVEAVVTSLITRNDALDGFFVQEEDDDVDGDPATSEGLFVFCSTSCPAGLAEAELVRVTGTAGEFNGMTQLDARAGSTDVVSGDSPLPTAAEATLPAGGSTRDAATFEPVEGMRATVPGTLAVSEYFNLARFGELVLTAGERPYQFTYLSEPNVEGYQAYLADLATRRIVLDDGSNDQNDAISGPDANEPYPYPTPGLSTDDSFRGGDTIEGLTGVMDWSFGAWRIRPVADEDYVFAAVNPRPASPAEVGGSLTVASFNVLNYFTTIDATSSGSSGPCGPSGTLDCRGADSVAELDRQRAKIVAALVEMDADVVGLVEIQNDDDASVADLVAALNAATAEGTYDYVETGFVGTDAIKQALVYQPASVTPVGAHAVLDSSVDERFDTRRNRPALAQTFQENATGEQVTVVVNHLKSKGSSCGAGDDSPQDGSANCDGTRTRAATALVEWLATDPTGSGDPDVLVIGDLNAHRNERPILVLEDAGYTDLLAQFVGDDAYTYLFDGQLSYLDHALANGSLLGQVTGTTAWNVNADEPPLLDYNDTVQDAGEASFERKSAALTLYAPDAYRSSDHDPVLVGLDLTAGPIAGPRAHWAACSPRGRTVSTGCAGSGSVGGEVLDEQVPPPLLGVAPERGQGQVLQGGSHPRSRCRHHRPTGCPVPPGRARVVQE